MNAAERTLLYVLPAVLLMVEAAALITNASYAPHHFLNPANQNLEFTIAALGVTIAGFRQLKLIPALGLGLVFEAARLAFLAWRHLTFAQTFSSTGLGFWYACLVLTALPGMSKRAAGRRETWEQVALIFAFPAMIPLLAFFLWLTPLLLVRTYDLYLYAFDGLLPVQASRIVATGFLHHPVLKPTFLVVYRALEGVFGFYVVLQRAPDGGPSGHLILRWALAGCLGYIGYYCFPGVGPRVTFGGLFPDNLPSPGGVALSLLSAAGDEPRNAMPSLHATWVFLIVLGARHMSRTAGTGAAAFALATLVATLGLGEHYLVDLVVAVPFTVAVDAIASLLGSRTRARQRVVAAVGGLALTVAWMLTVRYGVGPLREVRWLASLLILGTITVSAWLAFGRGAGHPSMLDDQDQPVAALGR